MKKITIQNFDRSRLTAIGELQTAYSAIYPEAPVIPGEVYLSPAFEDGRNLFCALDEENCLAGYAPLYPVLIHEPSDLPHILWTEIKVHPGVDSPAEVKDRLLEQILVRAREVTNPFPGHPIHLTFQYFPSENASIEYVLSRGCRHTESVFAMRRDLSKGFPPHSRVESILFRPWKMESEAEQRMYVQARNQCFPETPTALEEWQYFMSSPMWSAGTTFAAFHRDQLIGNTTVFWNEEENAQTGTKVGYTEFIFVHPEWRGKGIARELILLGLDYLKDHGLEEARLEVRTRNRHALELYQSLGFEVIRESRFYVLEVKE